MNPLPPANTLRLKTDPCARAALYLAEAAHENDGAPFLSVLWRVAQRLEPVTGVEDDFEGVELAMLHETGERIFV